MNDEATTQPADVGQLDRHVRPTLEESLGRYWDAAYAEGREGRAHDTENGEAQQALNDIMAAVAEMIDAAHAADVDILAEYSRQDGRREWVDVGTWLRPGEVVAHMDDPRPCEGLCFTHPKREDSGAPTWPRRQELPGQTAHGTRGSGAPSTAPAVTTATPKR